MVYRKKKSEHYVNNKEFLAAIIEYKRLVALADEAEKPRPRIPNYLGDCFEDCNALII